MGVRSWLNEGSRVNIPILNFSHINFSEASLVDLSEIDSVGVIDLDEVEDGVVIERILTFRDTGHLSPSFYIVTIYRIELQFTLVNNLVSCVLLGDK